MSICEKIEAKVKWGLSLFDWASPADKSSGVDPAEGFDAIMRAYRTYKGDLARAKALHENRCKEIDIATNSAYATLTSLAKVQPKLLDLKKSQAKISRDHQKRHKELDRKHDQMFDDLTFNFMKEVSFWANQSGSN